MHDVHIECAFKMILDSFNIMLGFVDRGQPGGCSIPAIVPQDNLIVQLDVALEILAANSQNLDLGSKKGLACWIRALDWIWNAILRTISVDWKVS